MSKCLESCYRTGCAKGKDRVSGRTLTCCCAKRKENWPR